MNEKTIKSKTLEDIESALAQSLAEGYKATIAIVFLTAVAANDSLSAILRAEGISVFGARTAQKCTEDVLDNEQSIGALLLNMNPDHFKIILKDYNELPPFEAAKAVNRYHSAGYWKSDSKFNYQCVLRGE